MSRLLGIAAIQMAPVPYDPEATFVKMETVVAQTSAMLPWVDMFCFPELVLDGLTQFIPAGGRQRVPQCIPGPMTERLSALAAQYRKWLIPGSMSEADDGAIYNTAVVMSPTGELVARYRKMFPWHPLEVCTPGDSFCVFEVPGVGRFGLCICYDMWFPEVARTLAWMGAEVILHPSLTATSDRTQELVISQANAIFNQCYFVDVNGTGPYGGGRSLIVDPDGRVLQQADQHESVLTEILDLDRVSRAREFGTLGLSQTWKALRDNPVYFPPYAEGLAASSMVQRLGPMRYPSSLSPGADKET
jgi:formamidase